MREGAASEKSDRIVVGPIDIEKLAELQGEFGIPHFEKDKKDKDHD